MICLYLNKSNKVKNLSILIFIAILMISCGQSALNYNDTLIEPQIRIAAGLDTIFNPQTTIEAIKKQREKIVEYANDGLNQTIQAGDFKGEKNFKEAATKYYSFVNTYFSDDELDSLIYKINSPDRIGRLDSTRISILQKDLNNYLKIEQEILNQQQIFARKNDLKLKVNN